MILELHLELLGLNSSFCIKGKRWDMSKLAIISLDMHSVLISL
jgi:hypothetical protein